METIVLLPAAATTGRMWRWQSEALAGRFRVLTPDLPGHGDVPGRFTLERAVAQVAEQIDSAPAPVHLCGISLSATVAVLTCLARPRRVRSLVLSGGVAHPPAALALQRAAMALLPERAIERLLTGQLRRTMTGVPADQRAEMLTGGVADFRAIGKSTYLDTLRELARTDLRDRLPQVHAPTLVLCGERDTPNLRGARQLAAGIPGSQLRTIPDAGHLWNLQHPALFTQTLAGFVDQATAG